MKRGRRGLILVNSDYHSKKLSCTQAVTPKLGNKHKFSVTKLVFNTVSKFVRIGYSNQFSTQDFMDVKYYSILL